MNGQKKCENIENMRIQEGEENQKEKVKWKERYGERKHNKERVRKT